LSPVAFILIAKTAFMRPVFWHYYEKVIFFLPLMEKDKKRVTHRFGIDGVGQKNFMRY
jgi:hypothetical protein